METLGGARRQRRQVPGDRKCEDRQGRRAAAARTEARARAPLSGWRRSGCGRCSRRCSTERGRAQRTWPGRSRRGTQETGALDSPREREAHERECESGSGGRDGKRVVPPAGERTPEHDLGEPDRRDRRGEPEEARVMCALLEDGGRENHAEEEEGTGIVATSARRGTGTSLCGRPEAHRVRAARTRHRGRTGTRRSGR